MLTANWRFGLVEDHNVAVAPWFWGWLCGLERGREFVGMWFILWKGKGCSCGLSCNEKYGFDHAEVSLSCVNVNFRV